MNPAVLLGCERFMNPIFLVFLGPIILLWIAEMTREVSATIMLPTADIAADAMKKVDGGSHRLFLRRLPPLLRAMGLCCLVIALARPVHNLRPLDSQAPAIDIMLCVDVSGSMQAMDFFEGQTPRDRLHVTKNAVKDFINNRRDQDASRFGRDRLGLVLYAGYAWTQCPLTFDYLILEKALDRAVIDLEDSTKGGTAIGDAIALGVARLRRSQAASRVMVILTDGRNNRGILSPGEAAQLASKYSIRIYTIGAGSSDLSYITQQGVNGVEIARVHAPVDEESLKLIADGTGGRYFRASDTEGLREAYREIDSMERTAVERPGEFIFDEAFPPWAVAGALLALMGILSRRLWFESIP